MNTPANTEPAGRPLRTSDLASAGSRSSARQQQEEMSQRPAADADEIGADEIGTRQSAAAGGPEQLDPLFTPEVANDYRVRWTAVQSSFVDDPRSAVQQGDELVAQVMKSLAESFAEERDKVEEQMGQTGEASTEALRVALRRYRSFFERLLSL